MPHFPRILLAAAPDCTLPRLPFPAEPVHIAYRIGPHLQLLRARPELALEGGFLMISGAASCCHGNFVQFCQLVLEECRLRNAAGIVANWELSQQSVDLAKMMDHTLAKAGLAFWVPEHFASAVTNGTIMVSSQLSGGTLSARLQEAQKRWGGRVSLAVECTPWDFRLPCPTGHGSSLEEGQIRRQMTAHNARPWFSNALCTQYFTYLEESHLHLVQFDNASSIRRKLELTEQLHLSGVILSWDEIRPFAHDIYPTAQNRAKRNSS